MHAAPWIVVWISLSLLACHWQSPIAATADPAAGWRTAKIDAAEINESSGLVASRRYPGILWTHNDSGDRPRFFAIDLEGRKQSEFVVRGASHVDWEDIAIDDAGHLYLADFGNNRGDRRDLVIYRVREPDPSRAVGEVSVERAIRFRYADQSAYPERDRHVFDAESLVWQAGDLYVFTKHRTDTRSRIYRIPDDARASDASAEYAAQAIAELELGGRPARRTGNTTAADLREDGRLLALLTYSGILLYEPDERLAPGGPIARIDLEWRRTGQVESIAFVGKALVFGNEGRDLYRIERPLEPRWRRFPP